MILRILVQPLVVPLLALGGIPLLLVFRIGRARPKKGDGEIGAGNYAPGNE